MRSLLPAVRHGNTPCFSILRSKTAKDEAWRGRHFLRNREGIYYVGSTSDLNRRLQEHKRKHANSKYTKMGEWRVVYFEEYRDINEARKVELEIKRSRFKRDQFYKKAESSSAVPDVRQVG